ADGCVETPSWHAGPSGSLMPKEVGSLFLLVQADARTARRLTPALDTQMNSKAPPDFLDDCRVLAYAIVSDSVVFTGRLRLFVGDAWLGRVPRLAICEYREREELAVLQGSEPRTSSELVVLHCNENWEVLGFAGWNGAGVAPPESVSEVVSIMERYYAGLQSDWTRVAAVSN
ncbi:hypothetical protein, partial [Dokdonella immobilis]|uniref:hypothetical protein n=1 Tax=Dokdonella immobilis TaxID=578942 RepID=UPI001C31AE31